MLWLTLLSGVNTMKATNRESEEMERLLEQARNREEFAREKLILLYKPFVLKVTTQICGRYLNWEQDDELSIALIAFNEAIDAYNPNGNMSFLRFSQGVIHRRLVDFFRKEGKQRRFYSVTFDPKSNKEIEVIDQSSAWEHYRARDQQESLSEAVAAFKVILGAYGMTVSDLLKACPKHRDTRENLMDVARTMSLHDDLLNYLKKNKQVPVKELSLVTGVSRRVLENGRKFLIAICLILAMPELYPLRSFTIFPDAGLPDK